MKRPSRALCLVVREVVKPMAPACSASSVRRGHLLDLALGRDFGVFGAAIAHHVEAQRAVRQLRGHVDRAVHRGQRVEIVGEGSPS